MDLVEQSVAHDESPFAAGPQAMFEGGASDGRTPPFAGEWEILRPDDRQGVSSTLAVPYRWVCSLDITSGPDSKFFRGSGLLVGPRQVLTAAHNIYDARGLVPQSVDVIPARNGRDQPLGRVAAVAYSVPADFLKGSGIGRSSDFAVVTLERDIASQRYTSLNGQQLGHWGSRVAGFATGLRSLTATFLSGKSVVVAGYPGDKCGRAPLDARRGCDKRDHATTLWMHNGRLSFAAGLDGVFLHTADTYNGQSGSPVWMKFTNGSRALVGIHVDAHRVPGRPVVANRAVHINDRVLAMIRSWIV